MMTTAVAVLPVLCDQCGGPTTAEIDMGGGTDAEWYAHCARCNDGGTFLSELTRTMPAPCQARAERVRDLWTTHHPDAVHASSPAGVVYRLGWDAHAAGEYPRPTLEDAAAVSVLWPQLELEVWHHAAGATILGGYCCGTPASHRDALVAMARTLDGSLPRV